MDDQSKVHTLLKMTSYRVPHRGVTHRKPLAYAKAINPNELLMALAPSIRSGKGHTKERQT